MLNILGLLFFCSCASTERSINTFKDSVTIDNIPVEIKMESFRSNSFKAIYASKKPVRGSLIHDFIALHQIKICKDTGEEIVVTEMFESQPIGKQTKEDAVDYYTSVKTDWFCVGDKIQLSLMKSICELTEESATKSICKQIQEKN